MNLCSALDHIAESATSIQISDSRNLWEIIVSEIKTNNGVISEYIHPLQGIIEELLNSLNDNEKFSLWKETESGNMSEDDIDNYSIDWIAMGLEEGLLDEILNYAYKY